jgi:L-alanine-DL-glutamate epimerase-like enolase superfamily enzyme
MKITGVEVIYFRQPFVKAQCDSGQDALVVRINVAAALHFLNAVPNSFIMEFVAEEKTTLRDVFTRQRFIAKDGFVDIPMEPGLEVELSDEALSKFAVRIV